MGRSSRWEPASPTPNAERLRRSAPSSRSAIRSCPTAACPVSRPMSACGAMPPARRAAEPLPSRREGAGSGVHAIRASQAARRFELVEGTSSKFWEVARDGCSVTVRFGRIGSDGQAKTKDFASEELARRHADGLIEEKLAKGYRERARRSLCSPQRKMSGSRATVTRLLHDTSESCSRPELWPSVVDASISRWSARPLVRGWS